MANPDKNLLTKEDGFNDVLEKSSLEQQEEQKFLTSQDLYYLSLPPIDPDLQKIQEQIREEKIMKIEQPTPEEFSEYKNLREQAVDYATRVTNHVSRQFRMSLEAHARDLKKAQDRLMQFYNWDISEEKKDRLVVSRDFYLKSRDDFANMLERLKNPQKVNEQPDTQLVARFNGRLVAVRDLLRDYNAQDSLHLEGLQRRYIGILNRMKDERANIQPLMDERDPRFNNIKVEAQTYRDLIKDLDDIERSVRYQMSQSENIESSEFKEKFNKLSQLENSIRNRIQLIKTELQKLLGDNADYPEFLAQRFNKNLNNELKWINILKERNGLTGADLDSAIQKLELDLKEIEYELKNPSKQNISMKETQPLNINTRELEDYQQRVQKSLEQYQEDTQQKITENSSKQSSQEGVRDAEKEENTVQTNVSKVMADALKEQRAYLQDHDKSFLDVNEQITQTRVGIKSMPEPVKVKRGDGRNVEEKTLSFSKPFEYQGVNLEKLAQEITAKDSRNPLEMRSDLEKISTYLEDIQKASQEQEQKKLSNLQEESLKFLQEYQVRVEEQTADKTEKIEIVQGIPLGESILQKDIEKIQERFNNLNTFLDVAHKNIEDLGQQYTSEAIREIKLRPLENLLTNIELLKSEFDEAKNQNLSQSEKNFEVQEILRKSEILREEFEIKYKLLAWQTEQSEFVLAYQKLSTLPVTQNQNISDLNKRYKDLLRSAYIDKLNDFNPEKLKEIKLQQEEINAEIEKLLQSQLNETSKQLQNLEQKDFVSDEETVSLREMYHEIRDVTETIKQNLNDSNTLISIVQNYTQLLQRFDSLQKKITSEIDQGIDEVVDAIGEEKEDKKEENNESLEVLEVKREQEINAVRKKLGLLDKYTQESDQNELVTHTEVQASLAVSNEDVSQKVEQVEQNDVQNPEQKSEDTFEERESVETHHMVLRNLGNVDCTEFGYNPENPDRENHFKLFFATLNTVIQDVTNQKESFESKNSIYTVKIEDPDGTEKLQNRFRFDLYKNEIPERIETLQQQIEDYRYILEDLLPDRLDYIAETFNHEYEKPRLKRDLLFAASMRATWNSLRNEYLRIQNLRQELILELVRLQAQVSVYQDKSFYYELSSQRNFMNELEKRIPSNEGGVTDPEKLAAQGVVLDHLLFSTKRRKDSNQKDSWWGSTVQRLMETENQLLVNIGSLNIFEERVERYRQFQLESEIYQDTVTRLQRLNNRIYLAGYDFNEDERNTYLTRLSNPEINIQDYYSESDRMPVSLRALLKSHDIDSPQGALVERVNQAQEKISDYEGLQENGGGLYRALYREAYEQLRLDFLSKVYYQMYPEICKKYKPQLQAAARQNKLSVQGIKLLLDSDRLANSKYTLEDDDVIGLYAESVKSIPHDSRLGQNQFNTRYGKNRVV